MIHFGLIFLVMFLMLLVFMDYQEKRDMKRSLKFTGWILGVGASIYTFYLFVGFWTWSVIALIIIVVLAFSGRLFNQKKKKNANLLDDPSE